MKTVPHSYGGSQYPPRGYHDPDALHRENVKLRTEVTELRAVVKQVKAERDELRGEVTRMQGELARFRGKDALQQQIHKSAYTPGEKILLEHVLRQADNEQLERKGDLVHLCHQTLAHQLKMSENTIGRSLASFVDTGVLKKETERRQNPDGQWYDYNYYAPVEERLRVVHTIPKDEAKRERRKHYPCPACGSKLTRIQRVLVCTSCQHEAILSEEACEASEEEAGHQNDDLFKQESPPPSSPGDTEHQNGDRCDNTPLAEVVPWVGSDADALKWTAALFQSLAGDGPHILMKPDGPAKYIELKEPLSLAFCQDHLRGGLARGLKQRKEAPWTRGLIFDADKEPDTTALRLAGVKLAFAGYRVLWETSPSAQHPEGGHLVLFYDGLVATSAAYAHVYSIAPELQPITEHWPRAKNMRLPGGYYKRPEAAGWCKLISINTGEMASTGTEAARLMLAHQTPAAIVPALPKEPPQPTAPGVSMLLGRERTQEEHARMQDLAQREAAARQAASKKAAAIQAEREGLPIPDLKPAEIAAAFNRLHTLEEIHPLATRTHAQAIWRGEQDASVLYNDNGRWYDFGNHGEYPQHGDAFDLWLLVTGKTKSEGLREQARLLRAEILAARG